MMELEKIKKFSPEIYRHLWGLIKAVLKLLEEKE